MQKITCMINFLKSFWKSIFWAILVVVLSTLSGNKVDEIPFMNLPHADKVAHFLLYFVFATLFIHDLIHYKRLNRLQKQILFIALLVIISYGGLMELLQGGIKSIHRSEDLFDFMANSFGAVAAAIIFRFTDPILVKIDQLIIRQPNRDFP